MAVAPLAADVIQQREGLGDRDARRIEPIVRDGLETPCRRQAAHELMLVQIGSMVDLGRFQHPREPVPGAQTLDRGMKGTSWATAGRN